MRCGLVQLVLCVMFASGVISVCPQSCVSDMQCKGFVAVNDLIYCYRNCCSSKDTVVAYSRDTLNCVGDMEAWTSSGANAYPWLAFIVVDASPQCVSCVGVLISPTYVMTDNDCALPDVTTNVYFNFDNPHTRQLYTPVSVYPGIDVPGHQVINYIQIQYGGTGTPLPLTPLPINCADLNPTSATFFHWDLGSPIGNRTFNLRPVQVMTEATCQAALSVSPVFKTEPQNYYCLSGTADNDLFAYDDDIGVGDSFSGALLMIKDANGNWLLIGEGTWAGHKILNPSFPGNYTIIAKSSMAMSGTPNMQALFGATCA